MIRVSLKAVCSKGRMGFLRCYSTHMDGVGTIQQVFVLEVT